MSVDCQFPSTFDILQIYDKDSNMLMELPLCEVIKGDIEDIDQNNIKMKSFESKELSTWKKNDFLLEIQNSFQRLDIEYIQIILAKDQTKVRI